MSTSKPFILSKCIDITSYTQNFMGFFLLFYVKPNMNYSFSLPLQRNTSTCIGVLGKTVFMINMLKFLLIPYWKNWQFNFDKIICIWQTCH